ncbi:cysteine-rich receptor-like protein kinase 6 [Silene latifolia]|uniref:cysteine-rich receptor-like protein kinase 6 n=1 Tax=Silene latifolia TaxID=37657 RepID=UPI003D76DB08
MGHIVLVLTSILFCQLSNKVDSKFTYDHSGCTGTELNYTKGSVYENNLDRVLNNLSSKSTSLKFDNYTFGDGANQVYGIFQCRFDISFNVCSACINDATQMITGVCPLYGEAIVWYFECMLRYSNRNIFSLSEDYPWAYLTPGSEVADYEEFSPILAKALNGVIKNASSTSSRYAFGETDSTFFERLYSFAQCTPDIDNLGCNSCLTSALSLLNSCCNASSGVMIFYPSCQLRYGTSPFLEDIPQPSLSPPLPPSPPAPAIHHAQQTRPEKETSSKSKITAAIAASASVGLLVLAFVLGICLYRKRSKKASPNDIEGLGEAELVHYDFATMKTATRDFSAENTLGRGGFGFVYKGTLENGDQLAIKRLSSTSGQGTEEFLAEARFLAKLQHNNVVKLVGFCLEGEEKLLVYDYMSNASLERFLFDPTKRTLLDWKTRSRIITGIAKGLQYLHEDSRLTIIHRDIKPENILLDKEMNPKIADFGLAKRTGLAEKYGTTDVIKGTQGYMAPECVNGEYSNKSDVYSFGIMLLEIVSGLNNRTYYQESKKSLQSHAWILWNEERSIELVDPELDKTYSSKYIERFIQIGLICVQAD